MSTSYNDQWVLERQRDAANSRNAAPMDDGQVAAQRVQHRRAWSRERMPRVFGSWRMRWVDRDT